MCLVSIELVIAVMSGHQTQQTLEQGQDKSADSNRPENLERKCQFLPPIHQRSKEGHGKCYYKRPDSPKQDVGEASRFASSTSPQHPCFVYHEFPGLGHEMDVWRLSLVEWLPELFR